jgi:hypothetical protein
MASSRGVDHASGVPSPVAVAAWVVLGRAPIERIPWWVAEWLADGCDGSALRELAGLNGRDPRAVNDLLPSALAEMGVALPGSRAAAAVGSGVANGWVAGTVPVA